MAIHPTYGVMMFALREEINGKAWGPWVEMFGGGHYEMESARSASGAPRTEEQ